MAEQSTVTAIEALDAFLNTIRVAAHNDQKFAAALLSALNIEVRYEGEDALKASDPIQLAATRDREVFFAIYGGGIPKLKATDLKKLLTDNGLADKSEFPKGAGAEAKLLDMLYSRAKARADERHA